MMKKEFNSKTLGQVFQYSTTAFADSLWCRAVGSDLSYTYGSFRSRCEQLSEELSEYGIGVNDKVAIFSSGTPHWSLAFFACTAFGRTAVPILPDFSNSEAIHVLRHSEAKVLFAGKKQLAKLSQEDLEEIGIVYDIDTLEIICGKDKKSEKKAPTAEPGEDDLAAIIYTSGTTGAAKGVMLTHKNIITNIIAGLHFYKLSTKDVMLSVLPLAHAYEMSLGMVYPFAQGASVHYLSKAPTPSILLKAMKEVRPTAMLTVPLIIEKVYKGTILPMVKASPMLTWMDKHFNKLLCRIIGHKMIKTFGGRLKFFGIGGAKIDIDVERFLYKARFPYYIGYGLTECAPLLALCTYKNTVPGQIGRPVYGVQLKLHDPSRATGEGEIVAKGNNIMPGYYKDPERTAEAFTEDGWFRTKDIASIDAQGRFAIKGRIGNMILGASGENIYPEEIEKVVKEIPTIEDVIVVSRGHKLIGLVKVADSMFDLAHAEDSEDVKASIAEFKKSVLEYVNSRVNKSSNINDVEVMKEPFEKTATMKIRRFKYKDDAPTV